MSNPAFISELKQAQTLQDIFDACAKYYDLKGSKLGAFAKGIIVANIDKLIIASNVKPKK